jgi:hypothetical protein
MQLIWFTPRLGALCRSPMFSVVVFPRPRAKGVWVGVKPSMPHVFSYLSSYVA